VAVVVVEEKLLLGLTGCQAVQVVVLVTIQFI
jgi:hypothetical protein